MPELTFKGKEFVYNYHLTVPYRPLVSHPKKSVGKSSENLVVHGDNLHALKALLPRFAGRVDCIVIDPPYNTGNEGWIYNDNVNSPMMKQWLGEAVGLDDLLRHDKWCCMMWPRLRLLHELLSDAGSLWITLDDNEIHRARGMLEEIFGEQNHEVTITWEKRYTRSNNATRFSSAKDYVLVFRKSDKFQPKKEQRSQESEESYANPDGDDRGPWITASYVNPALKKDRPNLVYKIKNPFSGKMIEHETNAWKYEKKTHEHHVAEKVLWWGKDGEMKYPRLKIFLKQGVVPTDLWSFEFAGTTDQASAEVEKILGRKAFETPKPVKLIRRILDLATDENSLVLDSFAGSGTTAHAVMEQNARDGGNRRYILVETEDYADKVTAERVRRVIEGYAFKGTEREELFREHLTWKRILRVNELAHEIEGVVNLHRHEFDAVNTELKDDDVIVTGEKSVKGKAQGLGGDFTFYTLGAPLDLDGLLKGQNLPPYKAIGSWLFHTATGEALEVERIDEERSFLGESSSYFAWLFYRPNRDWLRSQESALTLAKAEALSKSGKGKANLVFAPACFVPQAKLRSLRIEYAPLPFALYRAERG